VRPGETGADELRTDDSSQPAADSWQIGHDTAKGGHGEAARKTEVRGKRTEDRISNCG
jgi:hypothetical protein